MCYLRDMCVFVSILDASDKTLFEVEVVVMDYV